MGMTTNYMNTQHYEICMVGLGVMGPNLVVNMADHGFPVAGYDKDAAKGTFHTEWEKA
jgi:6-phosphogluconate dehydrogenase